MDSRDDITRFAEVSGIPPADLFRIFNDLRDYICVHSVVLDEFGVVVDARLRAWNRAYEHVRVTPVKRDQLMSETYFKPEIAIDYVDRAWQDGLIHQVFELTPETRDRYRPKGAVVLIDVLWQRIGDFVVEVGTDLSELRRLQLQLADQESAATAALHARIRAEEREHIARDLHDTVIQQLFASALQLTALVERSTDESQAAALRGVAATLTGVIAEIRSGIVEVRADQPSSLQVELEDAVGIIASAAGVHCDVRVEDDVHCEGEIRSNLRIAVRELVTNAVRHSHAAHIRVGVSRSGHKIVVAVSDDGQGLPTEVRAGSGMVNLGRRASDLGGSMTFGRNESGGTSVIWQVPLPVGEDGA